MSVLTSSVSPKGQITMPAEIRKLLGVKPKDRVAFLVAENGVRLAPATSGLAASFGAVPALEPPRTLREMMEITGEEQAREAAGEDLQV